MVVLVHCVLACSVTCLCLILGNPMYKSARLCPEDLLFVKNTELVAMPTSRGFSTQDKMLISCVLYTTVILMACHQEVFLKLCSILYCEYTIIQHLKLTSSATITSLRYIYMFLFLPVCFCIDLLKVECRLHR